MTQLELPNMPKSTLTTKRVINVASVTHRSPFRYPGGKTWLVPYILVWLDSLSLRERRRFIEPFAGGAIVGLSVGFNHLVNHVYLVELDKQVASVWQTIITDDNGAWLAQQIREFDLTPERVDRLLQKESKSISEMALQTIVKNRVNRGGILANGAGRVRKGENGKGIASRWYPATLSKRILEVTAIRDRFTFVHGDGMKIIQDNLSRDDTVFFIDPPYTAAGKKPGNRLYTHSDLDHEALFKLLEDCNGHFLMTYDNNDRITEMASEHGFDTEPISMKNTHHATKTELLISKDLDWIRN